MNINFNGNDFFEGSNITKKSANQSERKPLPLAFIFSLISLFFSFLYIPVGILTNVGNSILVSVFETNFKKGLITYGFGLIILTLISVIFAIISFVTYKKSKKLPLDTTGMIISICALVISLIGLAYNFMIFYL